MGGITLEGLLEAYYQCRHNKRSTGSSVEFEAGYESSLVRLRDSINAREWHPGTYDCFVVLRPRPREVFAAPFGDRVVQCWAAVRLEPLFEADFGPRSYCCRKGKGQRLAVRTLADDIRTCSCGYTRDCWVALLDIQNFYMSISRVMLADMLDAYIADRYNGPDKADLRYVVRTCVTHAPELDCRLRSPPERMAMIPPSKSLLSNGEGMGLAIGDQLSAMCANFLLDALDKFILRDLGFGCTGRYADDFYIVSGDKRKVLDAVPRIRSLLRSYGLTLHPRKFYIQHYTKGAEFLGQVVRKGRTCASRRTVREARKAVDALNRAADAEQAEMAVSRINSYLGCLRNADTYDVRRGLLSRMDANAWRWAYIQGHHESLRVRSEHRLRDRTYQRIRANDY